MRMISKVGLCLLLACACKTRDTKQTDANPESTELQSSNEDGLALGGGGGGKLLSGVDEGVEAGGKKAAGNLDEVKINKVPQRPLPKIPQQRPLPKIPQEPIKPRYASIQIANPSGLKYDHGISERGILSAMNLTLEGKPKGNFTNSTGTVYLYDVITTNRVINEKLVPVNTLSLQNKTTGQTQSFTITEGRMSNTVGRQLLQDGRQWVTIVTKDNEGKIAYFNVIPNP